MWLRGLCKRENDRLGEESMRAVVVNKEQTACNSIGIEVKERPRSRSANLDLTLLRIGKSRELLLVPEMISGTAQQTLRLALCFFCSD